MSNKYLLAQSQLTDLFIKLLPSELIQNNYNDINMTVITNIELMEEFERGLKDLHKLFPTMTHFELNTVGAIKYGYETKDINLREYVLKEICGLKFGREQGMLPDFSDETLGEFLDSYDKLYYDRQNSIYGDPLPSAALIERVTKDTTQNMIKNISKIPRQRLNTMSFLDILIAGLGLK